MRSFSSCTLSLFLESLVGSFCWYGPGILSLEPIEQEPAQSPPGRNTVDHTAHDTVHPGEPGAF